MEYAFMGLEPGFRNELLAALPVGELDQLRPNLHPVTFVMRQVLHEVGAPIDEVFFLESGLVSLTADTKDTGLVEVGMTGREGFVGTSVPLNARASAVHQTIVQMPGAGNRMRAPAFRDALATLPAFRDRCLRYVQFVMVQTSQSAACNVRHEMPERLARWLLMCRDRHDSDDLPMTQEFLSYMLGVRRAGVSVVANALQSTGAIRLSRGTLTVLDRAVLEEEACSCYGMIEDSRKSIMG
jgi:CRP-like cAMP-binding protein